MNFLSGRANLNHTDSRQARWNQSTILPPAILSWNEAQLRSTYANAIISPLFRSKVTSPTKSDFTKRRI
ncbi:hypothetical protein T01_13560 [Trichinella spiralis]|uniref:Uncharacterized protein n=1 Tax=Trichinella spiralis TaxID=6334 RepID=A0A0V1BIS1_TRISP|nr:hypothetical protein T01_13560 [Trichinella spiralis]